jgi:thiamine-phosphate pyrophosphorylase
VGVKQLPRLYAIVDRATLDARGIGVGQFARELRDAGVRLMQYRDKSGSPQEILRAAGEISRVFAGVEGAMLVMNDRADLALLAGWGVHVGQGDLPVADAKVVVGEGVAGVSTHNDAQVSEADASEADYVAVGPVFATSTKADAEAVIGLEGLRRARGLTTKPLVAIGGITRENARGVVDAGADSVAVISGLLVEGLSVGEVARDFLEILR